MKSNPFLKARASAGDGTIHVSSLSQAKHVLQDFNYQYPLKLIAPAPEESGHNSKQTIYTVFILTYGGGLVGGDTVQLSVQLDRKASLVLLTQGSTKVFKSENAFILTQQNLSVDLDDGASLCYLPDPVQPFANSCFEQRQIYKLNGKAVNICVLDWVSEGRPARGEKWDFFSYASKNEIWRCWPGIDPTLLLRDNLILDNSKQDVRQSMFKLGAYGTLIIGGPLMAGLANCFLDEFSVMPRIGSRKWDDDVEQIETSIEETRRILRLRQESLDGILWTAAATRGFVVVKFGAYEVEGGKRWLHSILHHEGSVARIWGERALLCLR